LLAYAGAASAIDWLATLRPTHLHIQRYEPGSEGITVHRDQRSFLRLISIFSFGAPATFQLYRDREGTVRHSFEVASGDLLLLRAPGFDGDDRVGPLHGVAGPKEGVRYSLTLRMQADSTRATLP
jgi:hypothetical protein